MKDEIKEILDEMYHIICTYSDDFDYFEENKINFELSYKNMEKLYDYITNLQEQLHQASLDIQELTEKDIGCPSWCDKLINLQEENGRLKDKLYGKNEYIKILEKSRENYKSRCEKANTLLDEMLEIAYIDGEYILYDYSTSELLELKKALQGDDKE